MNTQINLKNNSIDVLGIGNAIVDVLTKVDDSFLEDHSLSKGMMMLVNETQAENLYSSINNSFQTSGGSAANTIYGLSQLGSQAAFIGRVRNDRLGEIFTQEINSVGTIFTTASQKEGPSTARCMIFVTPDAQRTMCTYLGASTFLDTDDLDLSLVAKANILYLEGYLWDNNSAKSAFIKASKIAKDNNKKVALSLSDAFCVDRHRESFLELIKDHIDILFANESEITSLYQTKNLLSALEKVKQICKITAITLGDKGSIIVNDKSTIKIDPYKFGPAIDTTGAGDIYAGGFLYGVSKNYDLKVCGKIGSICAGQIVTSLGPRTNRNLQSLITENL